VMSPRNQAAGKVEGRASVVPTSSRVRCFARGPEQRSTQEPRVRDVSQARMETSNFWRGRICRWGLAPAGKRQRDERGPSKLDFATPSEHGRPSPRGTAFFVLRWIWFSARDDGSDLHGLRLPSSSPISSIFLISSSVSLLKSHRVERFLFVFGIFLVFGGLLDEVVAGRGGMFADGGAVIFEDTMEVLTLRGGAPRSWAGRGTRTILPSLLGIESRGRNVRRNFSISADEADVPGLDDDQVGGRGWCIWPTWLSGVGVP